ncbi:nucleolar protein 14 isoform X2 [Aplysia californica]|nr:nucleolar protein 14 isoform X2 [Aplysia californica]
MSWKEKMNQVIADSKRQKYERQAEKEKALETTNELDSIWKSVVTILNPMKNAPPPRKNPSRFMQLFHNLVMEQTSAGATDKTKTDEEKAKEEAEKLQVLEAQRLSRMKGSYGSEKAMPDHVSADDLNDGFALDKPKSKVKFADEVGSDSEGAPDGSDDDDDEDNEEDHDNSSGDDEENGDDDDDDEGEESDKYSDLASEDGTDEDDEEANEKNNGTSSDKSARSILKKTQGLAEIGQSGKSELPFIFSAPGSFEELEALLHGHSGEEQAIIISRLRKCHHPSLAEGNKEKLENIHLYLLQYFGKLATQQPVDKKLIHGLTGNLWELSQTYKVTTANALQKYIVQRQSEHAAFVQKKGGRGSFPKLETLVHLVLIENLFPASDFRHPVTTPALHFITQMLTECTPKSCSDVVVGVFLCSLALKFVSLSKRYLPEVVTFLQGLIFSALPAKSTKGVRLFPPFKKTSKALGLLSPEEPCETLQGQWSLSEMLSKENTELENSQFKCDAVSNVTDLMGKCVDLWEELPSIELILKPWLAPLGSLPLDFYPAQLKMKVSSLLDRLRNVKQILKVMQQPSKKPVPLKLFEPKIEEFWSGKRKKGGPNRDVNERQRLTHKVKREMKAAVREIKRDNEVLAKHQLDTIMKKDADRKRKMKELMHSLASQEGDYKAIKKAKK